MTAMQTVDPAALPELADVLRSAKRYRRLVVVCSRDHASAEVYGTARGPVLVASVPFSLGFAADGTPDSFRFAQRPFSDDRPRRTRSRGGRVAAVLDQQHDADELVVTCRCRTVVLTAGYLRGALAQRRRRVMVDTVCPPTYIE